MVYSGGFRRDTGMSEAHWHSASTWLRLLGRTTQVVSSGRRPLGMAWHGLRWAVHSPVATTSANRAPTLCYKCHTASESTFSAISLASASYLSPLGTRRRLLKLY
eukprot:scaffold2979_cov243-Pinguiococcus_pyrenoidosus.AAC.13